MNAEQRALAALGAYIREFRAASRQLNTAPIGGRWWKLRVTAAEAAAWADLGFYPEEAAGLIADGISPQAYREMEDHAEEQAGGPDALAAMRVAELLGTGALLGPDDVTVVQDPDDPRQEIIAVREDHDGR